MKHLKNFELTSEYDSFVNGNEFIMPNVTYVKDDDKVYYHALVLRNNVITYQADSKLPETTNTGLYSGLHVNAFNSPMVSHEFVNGIGTITFEEDVTSIGFSAFSDCSGLTSIDIPNSVTSIGESAFYHCSGLTSIVIPNGVTKIGESAFSGCKGLTSITIGSGVTEIRRAAFFNCSGLTSIVIPNSVTFIEGEAFYNCGKLTSINIPDGVTFIDQYTFHGCSSLTSINIPNSVTYIGFYAFYGCSGLTEIEYNGYIYQWQNMGFDPEWRNNSAIERVICLDGVIELNTTATVDYIESYDWDINLNVGNERALGFNLYDTSKSFITTAVYGEPKGVDGNYYYYQYDDDAISVTDYGYDGKSGYHALIQAKKPGTYYLYIYAGPGVKGDAMQTITITIS